MKRIFYYYVFFLIAGAFLVALPDNGSAIFILNKEHGPALSDCLGLGIILLVWLLMIAEVWKKRQLLIATLSKKGIAFIVLGIMICSGGVVLAIRQYQDGLLLLCSTLNFLLQFYLIWIAFKTKVHA